MSNAEASSKAQVPWGTTHLVPTETKITGPKDNRDRRGSTWGCCLPSIFFFHVEPCSFDQVSSQPYFFFVSWLVAFSLKCLLRVSGELFHLAPWPFLWPLPKRQPQSLSMVLDLFLRVGLQAWKVSNSWQDVWGYMNTRGIPTSKAEQGLDSHGAHWFGPSLFMVIAGIGARPGQCPL